MRKIRLTHHKLQQNLFLHYSSQKSFQNNILKVTENRSSGTVPNLHKSKMAANQDSFAHISLHKTDRGLILVSIPMFSGSRNPITTIPITWTNLVEADILNFKMAADQMSFLLIFWPMWHKRSCFLVVIPIFECNKVSIISTLLICISLGCDSHLEFQNGRP